MRDLKARHTSVLPIRAWEYHVSDLVASEKRQPARTNRSDAASIASVLGDAGQILDTRAKDAYRRRLAEIEDDLSKRTPRATPSGPRKPTPKRHIPCLELRRAVGLGGLDRRAASRFSSAARCRGDSCRLPDDHSDQLAPSLVGQHLSRTIRTWATSWYFPYLSTRSDWRSEAIRLPNPISARCAGLPGWLSAPGCSSSVMAWRRTTSRLSAGTIT